MELPQPCLTEVYRDAKENVRRALPLQFGSDTAR
jgi:hypothetical protein